MQRQDSTRLAYPRCALSSFVIGVGASGANHHFLNNDAVIDGNKQVQDLMTYDFSMEERALAATQKRKKKMGLELELLRDRREEKMKAAALTTVPPPSYDADDVQPSVTVEEPPIVLPAAQPLASTLTKEQSGILNNFFPVVGLQNTAENNRSCSQLLDVLEWNLEGAISAYFDNGCDILTAYSRVCAVRASKNGSAVNNSQSSSQLSSSSSSHSSSSQSSSSIRTSPLMSEIQVRLPTGVVIKDNYAYTDTLWSCYQVRFVPPVFVPRFDHPGCGMPFCFLSSSSFSSLAFVFCTSYCCFVVL